MPIVHGADADRELNAVRWMQRSRVVMEKRLSLNLAAPSLVSDKNVPSVLLRLIGLTRNVSEYASLKAQIFHFDAPFV